jgi:RNA-directed DNA polymerase
MGMWDWVKQLFGGGQQPNRTAPPPAAPQVVTTPQGFPAVRTSAPPRPPAPQPAARPAPVPLTLDQLEAGAFAPLSDDEIRRRARAAGSSLWNAWFGRRDLIPPASDPRTQLIDAGMLGHGFLSREELAEIHQVGAQMDEVRPDLARAAMDAQAAMKAALAKSDEERAAIKAQKKVESAERKRQRAEAVTKRRASDIVFLGRGVSYGLADRRADVEKLQRQGLPLLSSPADVATALELTIPRLRWLAFHTDAATRTHYVRFSVPKKSGGTRELAAPHLSLKKCQQWILNRIVAKLPAHDAAHGFVPGRSTVTNAQQHVGRQVVVNLDLCDFFPTITFPRVRGLFVQLGYSPAAATILALLATESPRRTMSYAGQTLHVATGPRALPQGACTSPALSNLIARRLDSRLTGICKKLGWTYTRYADDLTFSTSGEAAGRIGYLLARVRHIAQNEGFAVNGKKTRVLRRHTAQVVTGLVVNEKPGVRRTEVRRLRAILHRAKAEGLDAQNRTGRPHFRAWLRGKIAYVGMARPAVGAKLREALDALEANGR